MEVDKGFWDAVNFVLENRKPRISPLKNHFKCSYNQAARFIYQMEEMGVVSEIDHTGRRHVLWPELEFSSEEE